MLDPMTFIAAKLGMTSGELAMWLFVINQGAKVIGRRIPNDATGFWKFLAQACSIIGTDPSSVLTTTATGKPVTVQDVSTAALSTPPVTQKAATAAETK